MWCFIQDLKKKLRKKRLGTGTHVLGAVTFQKVASVAGSCYETPHRKFYWFFFLLGFTGFSYSLDSQVRSCFFRFFLFVGFLSFFFCLETNVLAPYRHVTQSANTKIKKKKPGTGTNTWWTRSRGWLQFRGTGMSWGEVWGWMGGWGGSRDFFFVSSFFLLFFTSLECVTFVIPPVRQHRPLRPHGTVPPSAKKKDN